MDFSTVVSWLTLKTALVGLVVFLLVMRFFQKKRYNLPPGPTQLPLFGNYFAFSKDTRLFVVFTEMAKSCGDIFSVNLGFGQKVVVLQSADIVHEALVEQKEVFAGRENMFFSFEMLSGGYKDIIFADYGPVWSIQRRTALKALRTYIASDKLEQLAKSSFAEVAVLLAKQKDPVDMSLYIRLLMMNIISRMAFGKSYALDDSEFLWLKGKLEGMLEVFSKLIPADLIPILRHLPIKSTLDIKSVCGELIDFQTAKFEEHKSSFKSGLVRDLTDQFLLVREELSATSDDNVKETLTDRHIILTVFDVFFAGILTSTETLKWTMMYVAANPKVQEKMHEEIINNSTNGLDDLRHLKSKLPYCEAVLREVMRLRPAAPVALTHRVIQDTKLGGYDMPKGTVIMANLYGIHNDPQNWEKPDVFDPERFLDKDGSLKPLNNKIWLPFSSGKRKCMGEALAKSNIMMILAMFFHQFKVSYPPGQKPDFDPAQYPLDCIPKPQKLKIEKR